VQDDHCPVICRGLNVRERLELLNLGVADFGVEVVQCREGDNGKSRVAITLERGNDAVAKVDDGRATTKDGVSGVGRR
jgi:hypothetical protein